MEFLFVIAVICIAWIIFIEPGCYAAKRGSSGIGWFIVSCFLPVISWALVLILYGHKPIVK